MLTSASWCFSNIAVPQLLAQHENIQKSDFQLQKTDNNNST